MAFKRRKARSRDPFEHLSQERDSAEEEMPWFLAPELQEGEDLEVQAGISSNISQEDLAAPEVRTEATPPEGYEPPTGTDDSGPTAYADLAEADHDALADLAESNHAAVAGLGEAPFQPGVIDQLPSQPLTADDLSQQQAPIDHVPTEHVPIEQLQEEPLLPGDHLPREPMPAEQMLPPAHDEELAEIGEYPVEQDFQVEHDQPEVYADDTAGPAWPQPDQPQPEPAPVQDWGEPARGTDPPPPDVGAFPPPAPPMESPGDILPPPQDLLPPPVEPPVQPAMPALDEADDIPAPPQDLLPPPVEPPLQPPAAAMPVQEEPGFAPSPPTEGGPNFMQDPGFQSLFPEIPDADSDLAEDDMAEPPPADDNQRRELTTSFLNAFMNQDAGPQPGGEDPANLMPPGSDPLPPSFDQAYEPQEPSQAQGPTVPRRPRRRVSRPRGY